MRQRTTPFTAGIGPLSIIPTSAARWISFNSEGWPGALRSIRSLGPEAFVNGGLNPGHRGGVKPGQCG